MSLCELETNTILPMRYLKKDPQSSLLQEAYRYEKVSDRPKIRYQILKEQRGFCAYSERFIKVTDETDIEHFDPRLKDTPDDGYKNWYVVLPWFNSRKPKKIEPFLPILSPSSPDIAKRIYYQKETGVFQATDEDDLEAKNLIRFLKWDCNEFAEDCLKHVSRIREIRDLCGDEAFFLTKLQSYKDNLSFATALEAELGIDVDALLIQMQ